MSPFAGLIVGDRLRQDGPFELWAASAGGRRLWLRRVARELGEAPAVRQALAYASKAAQRVAHENVILCHGWVRVGGEEVQISEPGEQVELEALIAAGPIDAREATWMIRQLADAIVHAESLELSHNNLSARHIYAGIDGALRIDFGVMRPPSPDRSTPAPDVAALAAIWSALLERRHPRTELPPAIEPLLGRALDAKSFAAALARVFYVDLDADDERFGAPALRARVAKMLGRDEETQPSLRAPKSSGTFTRMLEELDRPVEPKPLSLDEQDSQLADPRASTWAPGQSFSSSGAEPQPPTWVEPPMPSFSVQKPVFPGWVGWFVLGFVLMFAALRLIHT